MTSIETNDDSPNQGCTNAGADVLFGDADHDGARIEGDTSSGTAIGCTGPNGSDQFRSILFRELQLLEQRISQQLFKLQVKSDDMIAALTITCRETKPPVSISGPRFKARNFPLQLFPITPPKVSSTQSAKNCWMPNQAADTKVDQCCSVKDEDCCCTCCGPFTPETLAQKLASTATQLATIIEVPVTQEVAVQTCTKDLKDAAIMTADVSEKLGDMQLVKEQTVQASATTSSRATTMGSNAETVNSSVDAVCDTNESPTQTFIDVQETAIQSDKPEFVEQAIQASPQQQSCSSQSETRVEQIGTQVGWLDLTAPRHGSKFPMEISMPRHHSARSTQISMKFGMIADLERKIADMKARVRAGVEDNRQDPVHNPDSSLKGMLIEMERRSVELKATDGPDGEDDRYDSVLNREISTAEMQTGAREQKDSDRVNDEDSRWDTQRQMKSPGASNGEVQQGSHIAASSAGCCHAEIQTSGHMEAEGYHSEVQASGQPEPSSGAIQNGSWVQAAHARLQHEIHSSCASSCSSSMNLSNLPLKRTEPGELLKTGFSVDDDAVHPAPFQQEIAELEARLHQLREELTLELQRCRNEKSYIPKDEETQDIERDSLNEQVPVNNEGGLFFTRNAFVQATPETSDISTTTAVPLRRSACQTERCFVISRGGHTPVRIGGGYHMLPPACAPPGETQESQTLDVCSPQPNECTPNMPFNIDEGRSFSISGIHRPSHSARQDLGSTINTLIYGDDVPVREDRFAHGAAAVAAELERFLVGTYGRPEGAALQNSPPTTMGGRDSPAESILPGMYRVMRPRSCAPDGSMTAVTLPHVCPSPPQQAAKRSRRFRSGPPTAKSTASPKGGDSSHTAVQLDGSTTSWASTLRE